jgi:hypothetical protein
MSLLIVYTSPELLLVMVMILLLHDPMNGARGGLKSWSYSAHLQSSASSHLWWHMLRSPRMS